MAMPMLEYELEDEWEGDREFELEGGNPPRPRRRRGFFRGLFRGIGRALSSVARVAAPIVGTVVGGPLGGALGRVAARALREGEDEFEFEGDGQYESEYEWEGVFESTPMSAQQAQAEYMAAVAAQAQTEAEAEAMIGAATLGAISARDRAALRDVLPHLVRGTAILTRVLRRRRLTRPGVRTVPTIVRRTTTILSRQAATGQPVSRRTAAQVMASQTRRVLGSPRTSTATIQHNIRVCRSVAPSSVQASRPRRRPIAA